jgi:outer membrane immunogenic protein
LQGTIMKTLGLAISVVAISAVSASAADLPLKAPPIAPAAVYNWTGWYVGGDVGGAWSKADLNHSPFFATTAPLGGFPIDAGALTSAASPSLRATGITGGIHGGYNVQSGNFVYGGEADFSGMSLSASQSGVFPFPSTPGATFNAASSYRTDWQATLRGRIGVASNDWLFYATGGLAVADFRINQNAGSLVAGSSFSVASFTDTRAGWVLGAGVEHAFANNWIVRLEYLYSDYGTAHNGTAISFPVGVANQMCVAGAPSVAGPAVITAGCSLDSRLTTQVLRVGVSYKFGPVATRY